MGDDLSHQRDGHALVLPDGRDHAGTITSASLPEDLVAGIRDNRANSSAANTTRAYESDWSSFVRWCRDYQQIPLPASGETVAAYITDRGSLVNEDGSYAYAPSTITRWVTAINMKHLREGHTSPGALAVVKDTLSGIKRGHVRPTRRMAPLLLNDLKRVLTAIDLHGYPQGVIGHRDAALLVLGFAGAFRRSELAGRRVGDITVHPEDGLHVRLLTSKTDQEGRGSIKGLPFGDNPLTCPPCAFLRWVRVIHAHDHGARPDVMRVLRAAEVSAHICQARSPELDALDAADPLFRPVRRGGHIGDNAISGDVVNLVVKRRLADAGLNAKRFGGHSLRAGFVTQALRAGASPQEVMRQTGQRNPATVEIYRREHDPLRQNAVTRLGL